MEHGLRQEGYDGSFFLSTRSILNVMHTTENNWKSAESQRQNIEIWHWHTEYHSTIAWRCFPYPRCFFLPPPLIDLLLNTTPDLESSGTALDTSAVDDVDTIRELMSKSLQVPELKVWIESHNTTTTAKFKKGMSFTPYKWVY